MSKSIIIYFSRADENYAVGYIDKGNTEVIAEYIKDITGADIFKVERKEPYPKDYVTCIKVAQEELDHNDDPELVRVLDNIDEYDTIYVGSPIWWGTMPIPLTRQLERLNWDGKVVKPFTTHEGSGLGNVVNDLRSICKGALIEKGLAIRGCKVHQAYDEVKSWLR